MLVHPDTAADDHRAVQAVARTGAEALTVGVARVAGASCKSAAGRPGGHYANGAALADT